MRDFIQGRFEGGNFCAQASKLEEDEGTSGYQSLNIKIEDCVVIEEFFNAGQTGFSFILHRNQFGKLTAYHFKDFFRY